MGKTQAKESESFVRDDEPLFEEETQQKTAEEQRMESELFVREYDRLFEETLRKKAEERRIQQRNASKRHYENHRDEVCEKAAIHRAKRRQRIEAIPEPIRESFKAGLRERRRELQAKWREQNRARLQKKARLRRQGYY
ncbi:hypothetical protein FISHEDRAFT_61836 [Fistulina hepatica ATCC 64428]|uniref:Uncharacterized protein n=1 Tax=Fistulina hepatica ATCC 64428 TaxID=1128425 RepID=A0A0D7A181_9AGAR|nr:hypothetical protein FISHEDRAFT_61836 [Fistulina hepatica ATCC 64428]